jgi:hypothetical protein
VRKSRLILSLLTLALFGAALALVFHPRGGSLLFRATRVPGVSSRDYRQWQTGDALLRFTRVPGRWIQVERVNAATGAAERLPFSSELAAQSAQGGSSLHLSPDGRWLLVWGTVIKGQTTNILFVSELEGQRRRRWTTPGTIDGITWLPDSLRFIVWKWDGGGRRLGLLHSREPAEDREIRLLVPAYAPYVLGVLPDGRVLATDFAHIGNWRRGVNLYEYASLDEDGKPSGGRPVRHTSVRPPPGATVEGVQLSPSGDRLLWHFDGLEGPTFGRNWLPRLLPFTASYYQPHRVTRLAVSRLDGSGLREIGRQEVMRNESFGDYRWTPDGKRICFRYQDAVYTIPAD